MGLGTSYDWLQQEMKIVVSWQLKKYHKYIQESNYERVILFLRLICLPLIS